MKTSVRKAATPRRRTAIRYTERRLVTQHPRRRILSLAASAAALPAVSRVAWAQAYPTRPVRIIVGFAAGGGADIVARLMGRWLSQRLGRQFVVENRVGAGTKIAAEAVVRAPADGYTLLLAHTTNTINATLYEKLNFDFIRDITPVASIARGLLVMVVNASFPARTVPEFIAYAKANPGKINMASAGIGSPAHVAGELFKMMAGVSITHVPYRGDSPALADLLGGQVQVHFSGLSAIEYVKTGKLRALAVTTATRSPALPDVPAVIEFVPDYEASVWWGIGAPKKTPAEIVNKLNGEINAGLADRMLKAQLADLGAAVLAGSPAEFGNLISDENHKWGKVIRIANIKPE
jgi:tripartite-type tricarboxylate transporter receptor subunit TctC